MELVVQASRYTVFLHSLGKVGCNPAPAYSSIGQGSQLSSGVSRKHAKQMCVGRCVVLCREPHLLCGVGCGGDGFASACMTRACYQTIHIVVTCPGFGWTSGAPLDEFCGPPRSRVLGCDLYFVLSSGRKQAELLGASLATGRHKINAGKVCVCLWRVQSLSLFTLS